MRQQLGSTVGFLIGAVVGGAAFLALGHTALVVQPGGLVWDVAFFLSILAFIGGFLAPFGLVMYIGKGQQTETRAALVRTAGEILTVVLLFGLGLLGLYVLEPLGIDTATEIMVMLDGLFGFVWGGILGSRFAGNYVRRRRRRRSATD